MDLREISYEDANLLELAQDSFVYFIYGLFHDTFNSSDYIVLNERMISE
jgi:hypothetical protein